LSTVCSSVKQRFIKYHSHKKDVLLFKLFSRVSKKINNYTGLPDLKCLSNEFSINWCLELLDHKKKCLFSSNSFELNNFEASFSVVWSHYNELKSEIISDVEYIRITSTIPVYINLKNGRLVNNFDKNSKSNHLNINTRKTIIREFQFSLNNLKSVSDKSFKVKKIYENSIIKLFDLNNQYLLGIWNSNKRVYLF
jgi:hypothetical protein